MPLKLPVYLDCHATTPADPRVVDAMLPYFAEKYANASSRQHACGMQAAEAVENARFQAAELLNAKAGEIFFTSGATEANHLALAGTLEAHPSGRFRLLISAVEHRSVYEEAQRLGKKGVSLSVLEVDAYGRVPLEVLERYWKDDVFLVSILWANNEIGTIQDMASIACFVHERGALLHVDASQAVGKIPIDLRKVPIDFLSFTAHKFYGPKGIGALFVRKESRKKIAPVFAGGGQEDHLRSGTLNVPGIVGLGKAAELSAKEMQEETQRVQRLRDELQELLLQAFPDARVNGHPEARLAGNLSIGFPGVDAGELVVALGAKVACSVGSACSSGSKEPSRVLRAIGLSLEQARGTVRFGLGRFTTREEITFAAQAVIREVSRQRRLNPVFKAS